jgi:CRP-like cAMP-binding protein
MPRDKFEDLVRKLELAFAQRFAERLKASTSGAAILADTLQVEKYFHLLYIITRYLHLPAVELEMICTVSMSSRLDQVGWMPSCPSPLQMIHCSHNFMMQ